ncbi:MAG TPA: response regulator [Candidatus Krumholzibacteriaceae bacterium]|nr:response regulator [Candidatus Krumholzibacteriaceae bacterium]
MNAEEMTSGKILVVDDDLQILRLIRRGLESSDMNLEIFTTNKGSEVADLCDDIMPDIVILDILIPGENTCQIISQIKDDSNEKQPLIMLISGHYGEIKRMIEYGADDFLTKPFEISVLIKKVREML